MRGLLSADRSRIVGDIVAGVTLAALGIPQSLGYARIAGMPVITGLYAMVAPMAVFALLASSRHLVVGADSAVAAMLAAGLAGSAVAGSPRYVALAGLVALLAGVLLLLARLIRLGFLADFLSRSVLIGFLTGVGVQIAAAQLADMLGVHPGGNSVIGRLVAAVRGLGHPNLPTLAVSVGVIAVVVGFRLLTRRIPGALIAIVGAIIASRLLRLPARGVTVVGPVARGLPRPHPPALSLHDAAALLPLAGACFVVIVAQSFATSRAYAAKYDETVDENADLVGLGAANIAAAFTGTFVVNGSPTQTQMVDSAGGRSQVAPLTTSVVVVFVLLFLTGPLTFLPLAVLATIVFLIGLQLINVSGMRQLLAVRRDEFLIALLTAVTVVFVGVEQGIVLAVVASVIDHVRHTYAPYTAVLVTEDGHFIDVPPTPQARTVDGLVIYRFGATLYYANVRRLVDHVDAFLAAANPSRWFCLDCVAIGDVDFTAAAALRQVHNELAAAGARLVLTEVLDPVRAELDRYGITQLIGSDAYFATPQDVVHAFRAEAPSSG
ncbi:SulP family inorganic anion transporter [Planosporangium thailandense]|uniref:SulP family inorganic anion transporter n=1 Tax=Planosporangium thailandense TaxID=765197 RepID=A0ABX0Y9X8_9ACTN|nr:SulP family inorganic anion transporter [Planosporangium thailandense]NJC74210.1 SulP family inorganic anion transporter [Planosporangium thailandense]